MLGIVALLVLSSCTSYNRALESTAMYLNERNIAACLHVNIQGGGGFGATVNGSLQGFIVTGGIDPWLCLKLDQRGL